MAQPTRIYLTGFMGAGKSTIGPLLAERLQVPFIDLDAAIEVLAGQSIPEIFEQEGETEFRRVEGEVLRRTVRYERAVVALGGGAVVDEEHLEWVKEHGTLVYLHLPARELARRLESEADGRPLLQGEDGAPFRGKALKHHIEQLLAEREAFYEQAHHVVDADIDPERVVKQLYFILKGEERELE